MNIILEGPDSGGKSTLARKLAEAIGWPVVHSGGPEKFPGELEQRTEKLLSLDRHIFDRHPVISNPIYAAAFDRGDPDKPSKRLQDAFYRRHNFIVYVRPPALIAHEVKPGEDPDHVRMVNERFTLLLFGYDAWAVRRAHHIYRRTEHVGRLEPEFIMSVCRAVSW